MSKPHQQWVATGKLPPNSSPYLRLADKIAKQVIEKLEKERKEKRTA